MTRGTARPPWPAGLREGSCQGPGSRDRALDSNRFAHKCLCEHFGSNPFDPKCSPEKANVKNHMNLVKKQMSLYKITMCPNPNSIQFACTGKSDRVGFNPGLCQGCLVSDSSPLQGRPAKGARHSPKPFVMVNMFTPLTKNCHFPNLPL